MSANPNWARWVFASVATFLKQVAQSQQLAVLVEGLDDRNVVGPLDSEHLMGNC